MQKKHYVIRSGWNSANQPSRAAAGNSNDFETNRLRLVAIVTADSEQEAIQCAQPTCYNGQHVFAVTNSRKVKGLTAAVRRFRGQ